MKTFIVVRIVIDLSPVVLLSVQHECIPQAILSMDVLCQAKSGMGKTAVFVLATLQQLEPVDNQVSLSFTVSCCSNTIWNILTHSVNFGCFCPQGTRLGWSRCHFAPEYR